MEHSVKIAAAQQKKTKTKPTSQKSSLYKTKSFTVISRCLATTGMKLEADAAFMSWCQSRTNETQVIGFKRRGLSWFCLTWVPSVLGLRGILLLK